MLATADVASKKSHYAKPHAPIEMSFEITKHIISNTSFVLTIHLTNTIDTNNLQVAVKPDAALQITSLLPLYSFQSLAKQTLSTIPLEISATSDGKFYIYINASIDNGINTQFRSFVIPIKVGNVDSQKTLRTIGNHTQIDSTGMRIISMPGKAVHSGSNN